MTDKDPADDVKIHVDVDRAWIQTYTGGKFHLLAPRQEEINIVDIAHALSMMCRFTGHVRRFYSVSEHSWHASYLVPKQDALWALLHDASEAYMADMNRPLKHFTAIGPAYLKVEKKSNGRNLQEVRSSIRATGKRA